MANKNVEEAREELIETVESDVKHIERLVEAQAKGLKKVKEQTTEFADFIREKGVVGLAVGIVIGTGVTSLVNSLVIDIINPLLGLVMPNVDKLTDSSFHLFSAEVRLGAFIVALINFLIVALTIFLAFKFLKLSKLDKKKS